MNNLIIHTLFLYNSITYYGSNNTFSYLFLLTYKNVIFCEELISRVFYFKDQNIYLLLVLFNFLNCILFFNNFSNHTSIRKLVCNY